MKLNEAECRYAAKNARYVVTTKVWPPLAAQAIWRTLIEGVHIYGNGNSRLGAWVFRGTRTPVSTVFENLQDMGVDELMQEFGVTREQVESVLQFAAHSAEAPGPRP
jgi:uncharacterized protein (DUF433 family)